MQRKSIKIWIALLVAPYPLLIVVALIQFAVHAALNGTGGNGLAVIVNIVSILAGLAAVLLMIAMPAWIIMLVKTINDNKNAAAKPQYPQNLPESGQPLPPSEHIT